MARWLGMVMLVVVGAVANLAGCGYGAAKKTPSPSSADLTLAANCQSQAAGLDLADPPALRHVPAASLTLQVAGETKSLCDLLRDSGKKLLVLQFVSVKCFTCLKWAETLNVDAAAPKLASDILTVAVVVDSPDELSDAELKQLQADVAPTAVWGRDSGLDLWNFFSLSNVSAAVTPLTIVMDWAARGFYCADQTTTLATLVQLANSLMTLTIGQ